MFVNADKIGCNAGQVDASWSLGLVHRLNSEVDKLFNVAAQFTVRLQIDDLVKKRQAAEGQEVEFIETEREAHVPLLEQLNNLNDSLAGIRNGNEGGCGLCTKARANNGTVDQGSDMMVRQGLRVS